MNTALLFIALISGIVLIALEIVALPGGIAGFCGFGLLVFGIVESYICWGNTVGNIILLCSIGITALLLILFVRTKTWRRFVLHEESDSTVNQIDKTRFNVGVRGKTIARLAPTGKALFDGQLVEVHAINKFIDPDKTVEIVAIDGYRIDVCEVEDSRFE